MALKDAEQVIKVTRDLQNQRLVKNPIMEAKQAVNDLNPREKPAINLPTAIPVWTEEKIDNVLRI